jgi:hypothetical protein
MALTEKSICRPLTAAQSLILLQACKLPRSHSLENNIKGLDSPSRIIDHPVQPLSIMPTNDMSAPGRNPNDSGVIKAPKAQACLLCQQRKTKCNRGSPCSNCQKVGVECVSAPTLNRPRKKRFAEAELLARLRRYEDLLRNYGADIDELRHNDAIVDSKPVPGRLGADDGTGFSKSLELKDLSIIDREETSQHERY